MANIYQMDNERFEEESHATTTCKHLMMFPNDETSRSLSGDGGRTQFCRGGCQLCGEVLVEKTVDGKHVSFWRKVAS
ncbi:MAG: hypothetical protein ACYC6M_03600 [Terriglobales bacterium]